MFQSIRIALIIALPLILLGLPHVEATEEAIPCTPEPTDMSIDYGDHITCEFDVVGDEDNYRFFGTIDELITIRSLTQSVVDPCLELLDPDGESLTRCSGAGQHDIGPHRLDKTGVYTVVVSDAGHNERGAYQPDARTPYPPITTYASPVAWRTRIAS